jgi:GST-like protein
VAGATHEAELPVGDHPFQLYSLGTPNGQKVTILLEELIEAGHAADYDAWFISIGQGDQFGSGFVDLNPNSKIPALLDRSGPEPVRVFDRGRSWSIWPKSSAPSCPPAARRAPRPSTG